MRKSQIDKRLLNKLIREGKSQREIAQRMGVSPSAVCRARKRLGVALAKVTVLEEAGRIYE